MNSTIYPDQENNIISTKEFSDPRADNIMELVRKKISKEFGVTIVGPYMTLRFHDGKHFVQVSLEVSDIEHSGIVTEHDSDFDK